MTASLRDANAFDPEALPYRPAYVDREPVYRFNLNRVVELANSYEMFPMEVGRV